MPRMSYSPESRSSRRVRQETQVEAITARLRRDRTGGHNPADAALACSLRSDKMGVVRVNFRPAAADLQGRRAAPKKPRRTGDFVGIGAVEAASLATGGAVVLQRAMFQFADGDQPNRTVGLRPANRQVLAFENAPGIDASSYQRGCCHSSSAAGIGAHSTGKSRINRNYQELSERSDGYGWSCRQGKTYIIV